MTYKYGITASVLPSRAQTPVVTGSCLVYFGCAEGSSVDLGNPVRCTSYQDYVQHYHGGTEPSETQSLDEAAKVVFDLVGIDHAFFVNCNATAHEGGDEEDQKVSTYIDAALDAIVLSSSERPNIVCIPTWERDEGASVWAAKLATTCASGKIAGRYQAFGVVGIASASSQLTADKKPDPSKIFKDTQSGYIQSCWGLGKTPIGYVPAETIIAALYARQDALNPGGVPSRSVGDLPVEFISGINTADGGDSDLIKMGEPEATALAAKGIATLCNRGSDQWYTWGDHTSAFSDGGVFDERFRFDSNVRMIVHVINRFIDKWRGVIDDSMTLQQRNDIVTEEQNYLNYLKSLGALIGSPVCEFRPIDNTTDQIQQGYFTFSDILTTTPPIKHIQFNVTWSAEGLSVYTA